MTYKITWEIIYDADGSALKVADALTFTDVVDGKPPKQLAITGITLLVDQIRRTLKRDLLGELDDDPALPPVG
jgi:hypothetical protein